MILLLSVSALTGAVTGYGLDRLLRHCAVEAGHPMARYASFRRRWVLAAACAMIYFVCGRLFSPGVAGCLSVFLVSLLGASCLDGDHMIIPDLFTIGLAMLGLLLSVLVPTLHHCGSWNAWNCLRSAAAGTLGLAIGSALVLWFGLLGEFFLGREVMGFGDVKFVGAIGAFCGWQGAVFALFGGSAIAFGFIALRSLARRWGAGPRLRPHHGGTSGSAGLWDEAGAPSAGTSSRIAGGAEFPFGPMLAAAAALYVLVWQAPVDAYLAQYRLLF